MGVFETCVIQPSPQNNYTPRDGIVESIPESVFKVATISINSVDRSERNDACRARDRSAAGEQFSARGPGASLPTARSSRKCVESRRERETWSSGNPSIDI